uniref:Uncharacterized protein n=1 Tax=Sipha flava TaxID=143950 RepID=A0A2S2QFH7_9HEMI
MHKKLSLINIIRIAFEYDIVKNPSLHNIDTGYSNYDDIEFSRRKKCFLSKTKDPCCSTLAGRKNGFFVFVSIASVRWDTIERLPLQCATVIRKIKKKTHSTTRHQHNIAFAALGFRDPAGDERKPILDRSHPRRRPGTIATYATGRAARGFRPSSVPAGDRVTDNACGTFDSAALMLVAVAKRRGGVEEICPAQPCLRPICAGGRRR